MYTYLSYQKQQQKEKQKESQHSRRLVNSLQSESERVNEFGDLDCLLELKKEDELTKIQYRDCKIDYTSCPNKFCIKNLA